MGHFHVRRPQVDGKPGITCVGDHACDTVQGQDVPGRVMRLHRPERLVDLQTPHAASTRWVPPPVRGTIQTSS